MNDLVRLVGDTNKKLAMIAIIAERLLDVLVLSLFIFTRLSSLSHIRITHLLLFFVVIVFIQMSWRPLSVENICNRLALICLAFLNSLLHWLLAFNLYSKIWTFVSSRVGSLNGFETSSIPTLISLSEFSKIVLLSTLPLTPLAGYGSREVSAALVFNRFPITGAFITLCYSALLGLFAIICGIVVSNSVKPLTHYVRWCPWYRLR